MKRADIGGVAIDQAFACHSAHPSPAAAASLDAVQNDFDGYCDEANAATNALLEMPPPSWEALAEKLDVMVGEYANAEIDVAVMAEIAADVRRLALTGRAVLS